MRLQQVLTIAALAVTVARAEAQPVTRFSDLGLRLDVGDEVRIVDRDGAPHDGRIVGVTAEEIVLTGRAGERRFTAESAARVLRDGDSLRNGILIGAVPGFLLGFTVAANAPTFGDSGVAGSAAIAGGVLGLAGAGIGALVDAMHQGRTEVYRMAPRRVTVGALVTPRRLAAVAMVRW
jgi:hypothetical protein